MGMDGMDGMDAHGIMESWMQLDAHGCADAPMHRPGREMDGAGAAALGPSAAKAIKRRAATPAGSPAEDGFLHSSIACLGRW
jgi:hypothetical protein